MCSCVPLHIAVNKHLPPIPIRTIIKTIKLASVLANEHAVYFESIIRGTGGCGESICPLMGTQVSHSDIGECSAIVLMIYRPRAISPRRTMQVQEERATNAPSAFVTSHSTMPTTRPRFTTFPTARSFSFQTGRRKLILSSSVVNDSPSSSVE